MIQHNQEEKAKFYAGVMRESNNNCAHELDVREEGRKTTRPLYFQLSSFHTKHQNVQWLTSETTNKGRGDQHLDGDKLEQMNKYHHV
jgi:hypothetical protein